MQDASPEMLSIFCGALERSSGDDRASYLQAACGENAELRARLEALLRAHDQAGGFLPEKSAASSAQETLASVESERSGTTIGPYKLVERIGEGGMGTVWMAQQSEPVRRLVAVKLIKSGLDSRQVIARFEAERQALALMDHPNIAKVLDARDEAGRPYFVMELVKGVPITRYCDEHHLTPRQRLELFVPVCQAIQHAHQKGIIHRDIKPNNVLVALYDDKPVPKIIDFGVAKATGQQLTEQTLNTGFGAVVGTLEYMSPEQAGFNQLDIDTRSDIYSLGVLLYELLSGSPPFQRKELEQAGLLEMLRVIREQEPSKPSTKLSSSAALPSLAANRGTEPARLSKLVRGELDWIVMKALEKDRARRYETANGFAADVQRYLSDETVQACPPSAGYRFRKFARRNKASLIVVGLVLFFLVLLGSGAGWVVRDRGARDAESARQLAEREAEAAHQKIERQARVAGQVESIFTEVDRLEGEQKWLEALAVARRAEAALAGGEADAQTLVRGHQQLKDLKLIVRLDQIRVDKPNDQLDQDYAQAFRDYGVDVEELAVETSIDRLKSRTALAIPLATELDNWVLVRRMIPGVDPANWKRLVAIARAIDPDPLRDRLRSVTWSPSRETDEELRRLADSTDIWAQPPTTIISLANALENAGQSDAALRTLREAYYVHPADYHLNSALASKLRSRNDHEGAIRFQTAAIALRPHNSADYGNLRVSLPHWGSEDERAAAERACDLRQRLERAELDGRVKLAPKNAHDYNYVGHALRAQGKLEEAVAAFRKAIELDPKNEVAYMRLGGALHDLKKLDEAIVVYQQAIEAKPESAGYYFYSIGNVLLAQQKLDEAIAAYRKAIELNPKDYNQYQALSSTLVAQGKADEAVDVLRHSLEITDIIPQHRTMLRFLLSNALSSQGKHDQVIDVYRQAIEANPNDIAGYSGLADALSKQKKFPEAIDAYHKFIALSPKHPDAYFGLGGALHAAGKLEEAVEAYYKAIELAPTGRHLASGGKNRAAAAYWSIGNVFLGENIASAAIPAYRRGIELEPRPLLAAVTYKYLGNALSLQKKWDEAIAAFRKAIELNYGNASVVARKDLAFLLATCPEVKFRDPIQAVTLAKEAVELRPQSGSIANTLGVAQYRAGDWQAAITALEKSMELVKGGNSNDWFFLAMAYWQLGEKDKARDWYDRAVQWMDKNQPTNEELRRFRTEAEELFGIKKE